MGADYPEGRGRVHVDAAGLAIEGVSIAGHESFYKIPSLRALLEFGRAPDDVVGYATACLTHGHLDHAAGLTHHASRRRLQGLPPARVFVPAPAVADLEALVAACERLEDVEYGVDLVPSRPGDRVTLRRDLELAILPGRHRVASVGYLFSEVRQKLKDDLVGKSGAEIADLRARGIDVTRREDVPLLAYPGDCGPEIFEAAPELFKARVLLIECSFLRPDDVDRARVYAHLHVRDFLERIDSFENEAIVLTHFSQRYRAEEIRELLAAALPERFRERVIPFLPAAP